MEVLLKVQSSSGHPSSDSFWQMLLFKIAKGFPHCITRRSFHATLFLQRTSLHGFHLHFSRLRKRRISQIDFFFTLDTAPHGHFLGLYEQQVQTTASSKGDAVFSFLLLFFHVFFLFWVSIRTSFFLLSFFPLSSLWLLLHLHHLPCCLFYFQVLFFPIMLLFLFRCLVGFFLKSYQLIHSFLFTCNRVMWCGLNLTPRPKADPRLRPQGCYQHTNHEYFFCFFGSAEWQGRMSTVNYGRTLHRRLPSRGMTTSHKAET